MYETTPWTWAFPAIFKSQNLKDSQKICLDSKIKLIKFHKISQFFINFIQERPPHTAKFVYTKNLVLNLNCQILIRLISSNSFFSPVNSRCLHSYATWAQINFSTLITHYSWTAEQHILETPGLFQIFYNLNRIFKIEFSINSLFVKIWAACRRVKNQNDLFKESLTSVSWGMFGGVFVLENSKWVVAIICK